MHKLKLTIISKDKIAYQGEADAVFVPTQSGIIEVLPEHMQLVSALQKGEIIVKSSEGAKSSTAGSPDSSGEEFREKIFKVISGVLEVRTKSNVIILADIA